MAEKHLCFYGRRTYRKQVCVLNRDLVAYLLPTSHGDPSQLAPLSLGTAESHFKCSEICTGTSEIARHFSAEFDLNQRLCRTSRLEVIGREKPLRSMVTRSMRWKQQQPMELPCSF
jgi:hypothetical protein